jgi:hypothetical protein
MDIKYEPKGDYFTFSWKGSDGVECMKLEMVGTGLPPKGLEREKDKRKLKHFEELQEALHSKSRYQVPSEYDALEFKTDGTSVEISTGEAFLSICLSEFIPALEQLIAYRKGDTE